jgi:hypothetical protein
LIDVDIDGSRLPRHPEKLIKGAMPKGNNLSILIRVASVIVGSDIKQRGVKSANIVFEAHKLLVEKKLEDNIKLTHG